MAWGVHSVVNIERTHFLALIDDTVAAIRAPAFLPPEICSVMSARLDRRLLEPYDAVRYPVDAYRLGPTLNEYNEGGRLRPEYWHAAEEASLAWPRNFLDIRPRSLLEAKLRRAWNGRFVAAGIGKRGAYWPIVRELSQGTLLHWDDIAREYPSGILNDHIEHQFALNIFIEAPESGGELRVWKRRWQPTDEVHRIAFGYRADLMTEAADVALHPHCGDAVLFRPEYYHDVQATTTGKRVTLSLFVGITATGLAVWS